MDNRNILVGIVNQYYISLANLDQIHNTLFLIHLFFNLLKNFHHLLPY